MFVKKVKRKCNIRGCKCTDCFAISRTREVGNTVIICKNCLSDALGAIDDMGADVKSNIPVADNISYTSIFFNAKALGMTAQPNVDGVSPTSGKNDRETAEQQQDTFATEDIATTDTATETETPTETEVPTETEAPEDTANYKCPACGKEFDSERGLKTHARHCQGAKTE